MAQINNIDPLQIATVTYCEVLEKIREITFGHNTTQECIEQLNMNVSALADMVSNLDVSGDTGNFDITNLTDDEIEYLTQVIDFSNLTQEQIDDINNQFSFGGGSGDTNAPDISQFIANLDAAIA